ncbi:MAG: hypothetical protein ACRBG0_25755 [Lewinella sp.]|jgi:hypothetical protein|uniref:hypothetical protein n=1 Tax=Lewinella sp. TaxID=2004506 RepID=UPI003D6A0710
MKTQKMLLLLLAVPILTLQPFICNGQNLPESRFTVGIEIARGLLLDCSICDASNIINKPLQNSDPESYQVFSGHFNYRATRGLGLTANLSYANLQAQSTRFLVDNNGEEGFPIQQSVAEYSRMLTIGPQLFIRIGQGDLGLEYRTGLNLHNARLKAIGFGGEEFDIKYKMQLSRCNAARLSYTYWPTHWFGVQFSTELFVGNTAYSEYYEPRIAYAESYPEINQEALQKISPREAGINSLNFGLSLTYRLSDR